MLRKKIVSCFFAIVLCGIIAFVPFSAAVGQDKKDGARSDEVKGFFEKIAKEHDANQAERKTVLDGLSLSEGLLVQHFINIAFNETLWLEKSAGLEWATYVLNNPNSGHNKGAYAQYIERPEGLPKHGVLNKWRDEITVGIGWPHNGGVENEDRQAIGIFAPIVKKAVEDIHEKTGVRLRFIEPLEDAKSKDGYARLRVVPNMATGLFNKYKVDVIGRHHHGISMGGTINRIRGAVEFTPATRAQVFGIFVPEADNSIGFAACRILSAHRDKMKEALIKECLLRALGLPELSVNGPEASFLTAWNKIDAVEAKTTFHEGLKAIDTWSRDRKYSQVTDMPPDSLPQKSIGEYDARMLKILYCPHLKSGMDKIEVITTLGRYPECLRE